MAIYIKYLSKKYNKKYNYFSAPLFLIVLIMYEAFRLAWIELKQNKSRSILTALGIVIGVFAVTMIVASGEVAEQYIKNTILDQVGDTRLVRVDAQTFFAGEEIIMDQDDLDFVKSQEENLPYSNTNADYALLTDIIDFQEEEVSINVFGVTPNYPDVFFNNFQNLEGRFFDEFENEGRARVALVSRAFSENVLGVSTAINETFEINGTEFSVIGEYDGLVDLFTGAEQVYIPLETLWDVDEVDSEELQGINFVVNDEDQIDFVAENIEDALNEYRASTFIGGKAEPLNIRIAQSALDLISDILVALQIFLALIAVVSLIVGGIGVTNVMLMSVTQRIREIGIRKALGANTKDILTIFLSESVLLTTISGLIGAGFAQYLVFIGIEFINAIVQGVNLDFTYSWAALYLATVISMLIGIGFGFFPAYKASKLSIVDALRYE